MNTNWNEWQTSIQGNNINKRMKFKITDIIVKNRKRELGDITQLAQSIQSIGLLNPIVIKEDGTLVAGAHRLEACKFLKWEYIDVTISELDDLHAELAEIDENLVRNELHFLDRDSQLKRRKEIYEMLNPGTKRGGDRKSEEAKSNGNNFHLIPSFAEDTANKTGVTDRTIRSSIQRAKAFTGEQMEVLKQADINQNEATKLAGYEENQRAAIVGKLAQGEAKTVREAKALHDRELIEARNRLLVVPQEITLLPGDFNEVVRQIESESVNLIVTDPPYNISSERELTFENRGNISLDFGEWDKYGHEEFIETLGVWAKEWYRVLKTGGSAYIFTSDDYLSYLIDAMRRAGFHKKNSLVWHKTNPGTMVVKTNYRTSIEYIVYCTKGQGGHTFNWQGDERDIMHNHIETPICQGNERLVDAKGHTLHPTQKPEQVIRHLVTVSSNPGDVVFDGFSGTGTTAKVAYEMGRRFVGIEQDPVFYAASRGRVAS